VQKNYLILFKQGLEKNESVDLKEDEDDGGVMNREGKGSFGDREGKKKGEYPKERRSKQLFA